MRNLITVIVVILIVTLGALYLSGCYESQVKTTSFPASTEEIPDPILAEEGSGNEVRVIFITDSGWPLQESTVNAELKRIVNSGEYDIISVKTIYDSGRSGYLVSAEVWYRVQQE